MGPLMLSTSSLLSADSVKKNVHRQFVVIAKTMGLWQITRGQQVRLRIVNGGHINVMPVTRKPVDVMTVWCHITACYLWRHLNVFYLRATWWIIVLSEPHSRCKKNIVFYRRHQRRTLEAMETSLRQMLQLRQQPLMNPLRLSSRWRSQSQWRMASLSTTLSKQPGFV